MSKITLVTCLYYDLYGTKFNGTNNRKLHYLYSLRNIARCGLTIYCFCAPHQYDEISNFFKENGVTNIRLIANRLEDVVYHEQIDLIRSSNVETYNKSDNWSSRCVEIMWGKFYFLQKIINTIDSDYYFWIDAGLSHGGIINSKYHPRFPSDQYPPYSDAFNYEFLFNSDRLFKNITHIIQDKILNILCSTNFEGLSDELEIDVQDKSNNVIGGLFGGNGHSLNYYILDFFKLCELCLHKKVLQKEEQLMSILYNNNPEKFWSYKFETWYHGDWVRENGDYYDAQKVNFSSFFDNVLIDDRIKLVTLAIGENYRLKSLNLLNSAFNLQIRVLVFTDDIKWYFDKLELKQLELFLFIDIFNKKSEFIIKNYFNYRVKLLILKQCNNFMSSNDLLLYMDADCIFEYLDKDKLVKEINDIGLHIMFRPSITSLCENIIQIRDKVRIIKQQFNIEDAVAPFELVYCIKYPQNLNEFDLFFNYLIDVVNFCNLNELNPFCEAVEFGVAIALSKIPYHIINTHLGYELNKIKTVLKDGRVINAIFY